VPGDRAHGLMDSWALGFLGNGIFMRIRAVLIAGVNKMPQQKQPITERPRVEDESTGNGSERHGKHREGDEALPGKGSSKGGLNKEAGKAEDPGRESAGRSSRHSFGSSSGRGPAQFAYSHAGFWVAGPRRDEKFNAAVEKRASRA